MVSDWWVVTIALVHKVGYGGNFMIRWRRTAESLVLERRGRTLLPD